MKELNIKVEDNKYQFLIELLNSLDFVNITQTKDTAAEKEIMSNIKQGFEEMQRIKQGELSSTPLNDFLDEI